MSKIMAVAKSLKSCGFIYHINAPSYVNPQPFGLYEIRKGCKNRYEYIQRLIREQNESNNQSDIYSIESGLFQSEDHLYDIAITYHKNKYIQTKPTNVNEKYKVLFNKVKSSNYQKTLGSYIEEMNNYSSCWIDNVRDDDKTRLDLIRESLQNIE